MSLARRATTFLATVLVATALGHIFLNATIADERTGSVISGTPAWLKGVFLHAELGATDGGGCPQRYLEYVPLCASYTASTVADMLRERVPIDISLLVGGLLFGTLAGVAGGRWCAAHPRSKSTRVLHVATAFQLSSPAFFTALLVLYYFSSNVSGFIRLPFLSGAGDYVAIEGSPLRYVKAMYVPWLIAGLPLAAFVLRLTESTLREQLAEDYVRTARAKGLSERRVINHHALPMTAPAIAAMTGVNVSTLLLNVAVIEYAFSIPGMFRVIVTVARERDVPVMEGMILEAVVLVVLANFIADAVQARLDPRLGPRSA